MTNENPAALAADLYRCGHYVEALGLADAVVDIGPRIAMSWRFKAECLFQLNRFDEASACFLKAEQLGGRGTEEVMIWVAFCQRNLGDHAAAEKTLMDYLAALPADATELRQQGERVLQAFRQPPSLLSRFRSWLGV